MSFLGALNFSGYQLVPLIKLLSNKQNALLICDGVGVGKTISAGYILAFLTMLHRRPALVVCPPGLLSKWQLELREKFGLPTSLVRSKEELNFAVDNWNDESDSPWITLLPSSLLQSMPRGSVFIGAVIIDEIHNFRNRDNKAWKALNKLIAGSSYRIGLSATPINNGLADLASELALLFDVDPNVADAVVNDLWRPEKQDLLYVSMTRFSKEKLGLHFAKRHVQDLRLSLSEDYSSQVLATIKALRERPNNERVFRDEITYFRLAASSPRAFSASTGAPILHENTKLNALLSILDQKCNTPIIVFCEFELTAQDIVESIIARSSFLITGSVPVFERTQLLSQFRSSGNGVLVLTSVGAEGLDLQFCSTLVNYDLTWNPMVLEQRIGRIDRIGQSKEVIDVYNFVVEGSIDTRIIATLGKKLSLIAGSVLEPQTILSQSVTSSLGAVPEEEFSQELASARSLIDAVELSSEVIPDDYRLALELKKEDCGLEKLSELARNGLLDALVTSATSAEWRTEINRNAELLAKTIENYGA